MQTTYQYNLAGRRILTTHDNTTVENSYDALGRSIETKTKSGTVVKSMQLQEFDILGNVIAQESISLNPNEPTGINLNGTNFVRQTVYNWYENSSSTAVFVCYTVIRRCFLIFFNRLANRVS
jgi:YD repeat-containing protein